MITLKKTMVGAVVAFAAFFGLASSAQALTLAELNAYIAQGFTAEWIMANVGGSTSGSTGSTTCGTTYGYTATSTLRSGMKGAAVSSLQAALRTYGGATITVDGSFGPATANAVRAFQASKGLGADGIAGPATQGALQTASMTTVACSGTGTGTGTTTGGALQGGAGDLDLTSTTTDVEDMVKEGGEENIWGANVEADGSDVEMTSIKLTFMNTNSGSSTENVNKYIDEVKVYLNGTEVGSKDMSDFSKDSGSPDEFSSTISLKGAVVREGNKEKLYVAVVAKDSIESTYLGANTAIGLEINTLRFVDGTGAILSADVTDFDTTGENDTFTFEDANTDDSIDLKSSSSNPDDTTVQVDEDDTTDEVLALVARLDNDDESSDMVVYDIPVQITINNGGTDADTAEDVIESVMISIDGDEYEGDLNGAGTLSAAGTGTVTYNFDIDGDSVIDSGDIVDVRVYISFRAQDGNYQNALTTVKASIDNSTIQVENEDGDEISVGGAIRNGALLTLNTSAASVTNYNWSTTSAQNNTAGSIILEFKVEADGGDVDITAADIASFDTLTATGSSAIGAPSLAKVSGDADLNSGSGTTADYTVAEGDVATFRVIWSVTGSGTGTVTLTNVAGVTVPNDKQVSPLLQI